MLFKLSSPFRLAAAFFRTWWANLRGYDTLANFREWDYRLDKCINCEFRVENQCSICTCDVNAKTLLLMEQCPKKKWLRIWRKKKPVA